MCCLVVGNKEALKLHAEEHKDSQYTCPFCNSTIKHDKFAQHLLTHATAEYGYTQCGKKFSSRALLSKQKLVHNCRKRKARKRERKDSSDDNDDPVEAVSDDPGETEVSVPEPEVHHCTQCNEAFTESSELIQHMQKHEMQKPHKCDKCEKRFTCKSNLTKHLFVHTGEKPHVCSYCQQSFKRKQHLTRHMMTHGDDKPFECAECKRRFYREKELQDHVLLHSVERPHKCAQCPKQFRKEVQVIKAHGGFTRE